MAVASLMLAAAAAGVLTSHCADLTAQSQAHYRGPIGAKDLPSPKMFVWLCSSEWEVACLLHTVCCVGHEARVSHQWVLHGKPSHVGLGCVLCPES
jgi:hypothetical protein